MSAITLRPYQQQAVDEVRAAYRSGARAPLMVAPTGSGKCLGRGTPVLLFDGSIAPVEGVKVGDLLMGPDGNPRAVTSLASGREPLYRIVPKKGEPYTVNESHILSLRMSAGNKLGFADNEVVNISVLDYLGRKKSFRHCAKTWRAAVDFRPHDGINPDLEPYLLGLWLAEGSVGKQTITTPEPEIVDYLDAVAARLGLRVRKECGRNCTGVHLVVDAHMTGRGHHCNRFLNALRDVGVLDAKHVPHTYKTASRADRLALLAGYLDGDGYLSSGCFDAVCREERLAGDLAFVARSIGLYVKVTPCIKRINSSGFEGQYYRLSICGELSEIPFLVPRRRTGPRRQKKNVLVSGFTVEPIGVGDYFGFEISGPDRLFLLGDFTVTHNTVTFAYIASAAAIRKTRVLILVHRKELLRQTSRTLEQFGVAHGLIAPGMTGSRDAVQVASVQTYVRRMDRMRWTPDLIVVDEAHHALGASTWGKVLAHFPTARVLGVTATPERLDGRGLGVEAGGFFDTLVMGPSVSDLTAAGHLSPAVVFAPSMPDLSGLHTRAGDFARDESAAALDKPSITGDAVAHYRKHAPGEPAIAFCVSIKHAEHVAESFRAAGWQAASIDGSLDDRERTARIRDLGAGKLHVLTSCEIVSEGTDIPIVSAAILLRPTQSLALCLQQMGRALRTHPGKQRALILDHVGNVYRHGLPDEEREWSLSARQRSKRGKSDSDTLPVRQCERCYHVHRPAPACPRCGFEYPTKAREIEYVAGDLHQVDPVEVRRKQKREQARAKSIDELRAIARARGYRPGWAEFVWAARQRRGEAA